MRPEEILEALLKQYVILEPLAEKLKKAYELLVECYEQGGMVLCCGNGGSAADSEHIVGELMKSFLLPRPLRGEMARRFSATSQGRILAENLQEAFPAVSLVSQSALMSAYANDVSPDMIYAQQVLGYGRNRPILLIAMSTSGNSRNVVRAVQVASVMDMPSIAITGASGGELAEEATLCLRLPVEQTYQVQELTLPVYHALCAMMEAHYFATVSEPPVSRE